MLIYIYVCAVICFAPAAYALGKRDREDAHMDIAEKKIKTEDRLPKRYGTILSVLTVIAVASAASAVYIPLLPTSLTDRLTAYAVTYASAFGAIGNLGDAVSLLDSLLTDDLLYALLLMLLPALTYRRGIICLFVFVRVFFVSFGISCVHVSDVGLFPLVAACLSGAASIASFVYSARTSLSFADRLHLRDENVPVGTLGFIYRSMSALGCSVAVNIAVIIWGALI